LVIFKTKYFYCGLIFISLFIFLFHYIVTGQAVYGDGIGYYAYLHSIVKDGNLDTTNEYKHIYSPENNNLVVPFKSESVQIVRADKEGKAQNQYGIGVAFLLLPFYITANSISLLLNYFGAQVPTHGYSDIYQIFTGIGALVYGISGLFILERLIVGKLKSLNAARTSVLVIFFATNLLYYSAFDVINSHFASFFISTLLFYVFLIYDDSVRKYISLGLLTGLIVNIRPQDGSIAVIFIIDIFSKYAKNRSLAELVKKIFAFFAAISVGGIVLIYNWTYHFGTFFKHAYFGDAMGYLSQGKIDLLGSLFSKQSGLFTISPVLLIAAIYIIYALINKKLDNKYGIFIVFFLIQYLIISLHGGWRAAAYGGRMYISTYPIFALFLAELINLIDNKFGRRFALFTMCCFVILNLSTMYNFIMYKKQTEGESSGTELRTLQRFEKFKNNLVK